MLQLDKRSRKLAMDFSGNMLLWTAWFVGITILSYILGQWLGWSKFDNVDNYFSFVHQPASIYLFVIGILSVPYFLSYSVKLGLSRRAYYKATLISSIVVTISIGAAAAVVALISRFLGYTDVLALGSLGISDSSLFNLLVWIISAWGGYLLGWMIGAGFYRLGVLGGLFYVLLAIVLWLFLDLLVYGEMTKDLLSFLPLERITNQLWLSMLLVLGVYGLLVWFLHWNIRVLRIKLK